MKLKNGKNSKKKRSKKKSFLIQNCNLKLLFGLILAVLFSSQLNMSDWSEVSIVQISKIRQRKKKRKKERKKERKKVLENFDTKMQ
jgi:hypothetical protein